MERFLKKGIVQTTVKVAGAQACSTCHTIKRTSLKGAGYKAKNFQQQRGQKTSKRTKEGRGGFIMKEKEQTRCKEITVERIVTERDRLFFLRSKTRSTFGRERSFLKRNPYSV